MRTGIHEDALRVMLEGGAGSRLLPVRSRREALRTWVSLTVVGRFAESAGIRAFQVEV
ncbi:hypothetical protein LT722_19840 [Pseudomonas syringae pv. syringae]|uniref:hypothetical protein n=1 Tax=Pseudomonas syringae TaxID=317 RepID=UPI00200B933C|nr:hypothetical protein [Pseudomonas syringae]MCK9718343.1 hypothetical protein [Pseudomonas syringae pv. syringae]MCK9763891.1 hypothetical protein [Pseudomonas syringae pv. syringae]